MPTGRDQERPVWDEELARRLKGRLVLVGLTYFDESGTLVEQREFFGHVVSANRQSGILLRLEGRQVGEQYNLPPNTRALVEASRGKYTLKTTGEMVVDPDFTVMYSFRRQTK